MIQWLAIALGGVLGALSRHAVVLACASCRGLPWGVLLANVSGCFLAGIVFVLTARPGVDPLWRLFLSVGFLGAYTTFSAFSVDTLNLLLAGDLLRAGANAFANLVFCLLACGLGMGLAKAAF